MSKYQECLKAAFKALEAGDLEGRDRFCRLAEKALAVEEAEQERLLIVAKGDSRELH